MEEGFVRYPADLKEKELQRFFAKVNKNGPWPYVFDLRTRCWLWTASTNKGYGSFSLRSNTVLAHRLSFLMLNGSIDDNRVLDHLCRNTLCVNPDHLEPVTHKENMERGILSLTSSVHESIKTHCPRGHSLETRNIRVGGKKRGWRQCLACHRTSTKYSDAKRRKGIILDPKLFQKVSDEYYYEIMATEQRKQYV